MVHCLVLRTRAMSEQALPSREATQVEEIIDIRKMEFFVCCGRNEKVEVEVIKRRRDGGCLEFMTDHRAGHVDSLCFLFFSFFLSSSFSFILPPRSREQTYHELQFHLLPFPLHRVEILTRSWVVLRLTANKLHKVSGPGITRVFGLNLKHPGV